MGVAAFRTFTVVVWLICGSESSTRMRSGGWFVDFLSFPAAPSLVYVVSESC